MSIPPKRKPNRSERRAAQRGTSGDPAADNGTDMDVTDMIPAPPSTCPAYHFYWCNSHGDWHHHSEVIVAAVAASLNQT